jgi:hypothetical protein
MDASQHLIDARYALMTAKSELAMAVSENYLNKKEIGKMDTEYIATELKAAIELASSDYGLDDMAHEAVRESSQEIKKWLQSIINGQEINRALMKSMESQAESYGQDAMKLPLTQLRKALSKEIQKTWGRDKALGMLVDMLAEQKYIW